ncbi:hypothetical protein [uncultured Gammaproteobacteria bacterium]|uniref:MobF family relaxase n=1 Tax=Bathymodiolus heckerae thiotrophic gill symbiont TaxID=1052212 RepID=UPI0010B8A4FE|nr:MobF family relaxase [Bathymodiolus heckerae thiotrophic gill symbiont]CAC9527235.1 hypothetical protein [uncultured Gammaproteobacteria bacterium]CAC9588080.1 hypothetical protein [uncultured Gammaproteobacteria bacterium]CAC9959058.1 hypothetical protein [uncultured Gammaproteobacteria bacterium]SHN89506.1 IncW plasmid conjugative relaxase protein TrwC (TraI homolog) [Bathymodiolus heckerae thiotrophic gill symbiont]
MLSIAKISTSGSGYLARDNYYVKGEEDAGQWFGKGAKQLGLEGGVDNDKFDAMLKGRFGEVELGRMKDGKLEHHPGWDHTFSAPKSVSLLALVAKDTRLVEAHDKAVDFALNYLENNLIGSRFRMGDKIEFQQTNNMIAAKYRHDISREKDPQLHTHAAVLNATLGHNGALRSLDSPVLYEHKMLMGAMYQSHLANQVKELGFEVELNDNGTFDIKGVDKDIIDQASKRRQAIVEDMKLKGVSGALAAQYSSLATRPQKEELSHHEKQTLWKEDFGDKAIDEMVKLSKEVVKQTPHTSEQIKQRELVAAESVGSAIRHLSENEAVFKTIDIAREAIVSSLGDTDPHLIKNAIDDKVKQGELLHAKTAEVMILDNKPKSIDKRAYTTPELIQQEKLTLKIMREGRQRVESIITNDTSLKRENIFTKGQLNAAKAILTTKDRFINVNGLAGTGKTFMLEEVKEQADKHNYKIIGMAPSGSAANILQNETGVKSQTLQSFLKQGLIELNQSKSNNHAKDTQLEQNTPEVKQKEIWLVDESSFISTKQALAITKLATKRDAQVVLLGDSKQLSGIEAGKPFTISQDKKYGLQTVEMNEIIRQKNIELKQAVYSATKGDVTGAFEKINKNIIEVKDKHGQDEPVLRREIMANTYLSMGSKEQDKTLILVPANEDRDSINNHVRDGFIEEGILGKKTIQATNLINKNLTIEAKTKSFNYLKNNIVRFNRNYKKLGIDKGSYLKIKSINHDSNQLTLLSPKGKDIIWNPKEIASSGVELYTEQKRELREGETLFWRRAKSSKDNSDTRRTNEKLKILKINELSKSVKYVDTATGDIKTMNLKDFSNKHWEYAYCLTAHQAQGQTADKVLINLESWRSELSNQQAFYVEISRAKHEAIIFTDDKDKIQRQLLTNTGEKSSSMEQVTDSRLLKIDDILAKQQGHATSDEARQIQQAQLRDKADDYIKVLDPEQAKKLESEFRKTQSPTMLNMYDKTTNVKMKQNYQDQIRIHVEKNRLNVKTKDLTLEQGQTTSSKDQTMNTANIKELEREQSKPVELER